MTAEERRALLGDAMTVRIRVEARSAAEDYPPSPDLIAALRPILTARRKTTVKAQANGRMPLAA